MKFEEYLGKKLRNAEEVLTNTLELVGQKAVNEARENGSYLDQTGNLRSSIGYIVVKDGVVKNISGFEEVASGKENKEEKTGSDKGRAFAEKIGRETKGLALIVVAGMNYATYVEAHRNVLTSAELIAEMEVPKLLKQLGFK